MVPEQFKKLFGRIFASNPGYHGEFELVIVPGADLEENGFIRLKDFNTEYLKKNEVTKDIYCYAKQHYSLFTIPYKGRHNFNKLEEVFNINNVKEIIDLYDQYLKYMEETIINDIAKNPFSRLFEKFNCKLCGAEMELVVFDSGEAEETHTRIKDLKEYIKYKGLNPEFYQDFKLEVMHPMRLDCHYSCDLDSEDPLYSYWGYMAEPDEMGGFDLFWNEEEKIFIPLDEVFDTVEEINEINKLFKEYLKNI